MTDADDIRKAVAVGSLAFGAAGALTPGLFLGLYGVDDEPGVRVMTRLWGTRTAALGVLLWTADSAERRELAMQVAAAMNAADAGFVATARGISGRSRLLGPLTSAGFAAALAYALRS